MSHSKVLLTGVTGFAGFWAARHLAEQGYSVTGLGEVNQKDVNKQLKKHLDHYICSDLSKTSDITNKNFDYVLHLASITPNKARSIGLSDRVVANINNEIGKNALAIIASCSPKKAVVVSSCAVYGISQHDFVETSPTKPSSEYGVSKLKLETMCHKLHSDGMEIVIARPFNHIGPLQPRGFLVPDLVRVLEKRKVLELRNSNSVRDYVDVRDIAEAYQRLLAAKNLTNNVFNIASGRSISVMEIANNIMESGGYTQNIEVQQGSSKQDRIVGSSELLWKETGWKPLYSLRQSINDYLSATSALL